MSTEMSMCSQCCSFMFLACGLEPLDQLSCRQTWACAHSIVCLCFWHVALNQGLANFSCFMCISHSWVRLGMAAPCALCQLWIFRIHFCWRKCFHFCMCTQLPCRQRWPCAHSVARFRSWHVASKTILSAVMSTVRCMCSQCCSFMFLACGLEALDQLSCRQRWACAHSIVCFFFWHVALNQWVDEQCSHQGSSWQTSRTK